jgi:serine/threonine protein kinase/Tfp pilus assembly protein PilF
MTNSVQEADAVESQLSRLVDEFVASLDRGERPDIEEYAKNSPELATVLRQVLPALQALRVTALAPMGPVDSLPHAAPLGDFRLLREIGRGGMGIVYEAEQLSLGRRVALKVLPFVTTLDSKQLQRFKNEAQAAAHLHHQHIVPVYATGCERGVHFYAMQFIEGRTLAAVIAELRQASESGPRAEPRPSESRAGVDNLTTPYLPLSDGCASATTTPKAGIATERSTRSPLFFRTVAQLGIQAAEALEHAHEMGVVHRDIKPANLLVDGRSHLWVTDFGLAHCQSQAGLTMSGDLVGTLRYMSPEQALAQRVTIDHRTDIYSIGATLYELLTLEPVFNGRDRQELLRKIAFEEPRLPRKINQAIPAELETIVLKAVEKKPTERYATARELADDLERFLRDELIRAKRPSLAQRARRWSRRHQPVVWSAAAFLLLAALTLASCIGWVVNDHRARQVATDEAADHALQEAVELQGKRKWPQALAAAKLAEGILAGGGSAHLRRRVGERREDLEMVLRLEHLRLPPPERSISNFNPPGNDDAAYARAFRDFGIDVEALEPNEAAERIRARSIWLELAIALDNWAACLQLKRGADYSGSKKLLTTAKIVDPDPWRVQMRDAVAPHDEAALNRLATTVNVRELPLQSLSLLVYKARMDPKVERPLLLRAQSEHPEDFWINFQLGWGFANWPEPFHDSDQAVRFFTTAIAIQPRSASVRCYLANELVGRGRLEEALAEFEKAVEEEPDYPQARNNFAWFLATCPRVEFRDAARAVEHAAKAVELAPRSASARNTLGVAQYRARNWKAAIETLERAEALAPGTYFAFNAFFLAMAHWQLGEKQKAQGEYEQAVQWMEKKNSKDVELRRFRAEAEELMKKKVGIQESEVGTGTQVTLEP